MENMILDVHNTLGKHILADGYPIVMDLEKSRGARIFDERTGREYLDMFSMFASIAIGYNHPKILERKQELIDVIVTKPALSDVYCKQFAEFMHTFSKVVVPKELPHAFFIEGGGLAVENALKVAFDWKQRKNEKAGRRDEACKVIHYKHAFHGRTGYTLSLTNTSDPRKTAYFPKFDWPRVESPEIHFPLDEEHLREVQKCEQESLEQIQNAINKNSHEIAALIIETIQGEGGDRHFRDEYFIKLREICDKHDIFLIFDEVQTGIGITGKMWAYQHYSIIPDAISFGKKSQVCGILVSDRVKEVENHVFDESSRLNSTFGGNLIDMVRFKLILEVIEEDKLVENAKIQGAFLQQELLSLQREFPHLLTNARGKGLFCAFDCFTQENRDLLIKSCFDK